MKLLTVFSAAAFAVGVFTGVASAQTRVYITGSSAYRAEFTRAIFTYFGSLNPTAARPYVPWAGYAFSNDSSDPSLARAATFAGMVNGNLVTIKTSWSGSAAGIQTVAQTGTPVLTVRFLSAAYDNTTANNGDNTPPDPTLGADTDPNHESAAPDIAMSDNEQGSCDFNGTFFGRSYTPLTAIPVAIVPFVWVKSNMTGLPVATRTAFAGVTNMTPQLARGQWTGGTGKLPLSLYTGNQSDASVTVYSTGGDPNSGARIIAFAESGIGIFSSVQQFIAGVTSPNNGLYPVTTINGVSITLGKGGEAFGGTLAGVNRMGSTSLTRPYVSYMGVSDATTLVANGGSILTYAGVPYSTTNVQNGLYTFWSVENLMYKPTLLGVKRDVADTLATFLSAQAAIPVDSMNVGRGADGSTVTN